MERIKRGQVEASHAAWVGGRSRYSSKCNNIKAPGNGGKGISGWCGGVMGEKQIGGGETEGSGLCVMK